MGELYNDFDEKERRKSVDKLWSRLNEADSLHFFFYTNKLKFVEVNSLSGRCFYLSSIGKQILYSIYLFFFFA